MKGSLRAGPLRGEAEVAVQALVVTAALALLVRHVAGYYPLFDDFAVLGELPSTPLERLVAEPLGGFYRPLGLAVFKAQATLFGFARPSAVAAVSVALHVGNALLLHLLLARAGVPSSPRRAAASLFLLSPWGGEAFFWMSAQFDLLATLASLVVLHSFLAAVRGQWGGRGDSLLVGAAAGLAALAAKESAATLFVAAPLLVLSFRRPEEMPTRRLALPAAGLVLLTGAYLALRSRLLPGLDGPYGDFATLVSGGGGARNLASHAEAFLRLPFGASGAGLAALQTAWGALLLLLLLRAVRRDLRGAVLRSLAFLASLAPVLPLPTGPESIPSGRLLYLPGAFLVLLLAGGPGETSPTGRPTRAGVVALLVLAVASLSWQGSLWRSATALSRRTIAALEPFAASRRPLHVLNLPLRFERGPHVLKSYAFRYAYPRGPFPAVRADGVVLARDPARLRIAAREPDPFSEGVPRDGDRRLKLLLDDGWLR